MLRNPVKPGKTQLDPVNFLKTRSNLGKSQFNSGILKSVPPFIGESIKDY